MTATPHRDPETAVRPLRIGVMGAGRIGRMHAELVARDIPGAALQTVYDPFDEGARELADRLGVHHANSVEELLEDDDVDAVAICSSTDSHAELL
ncbi:MAG: Gfo/Idh/MocA family oxidoreductase, partial [Gaiellaceae bacterium]